MSKLILKRGAMSFCISAICGLIVNLVIELAAGSAAEITESFPLSPEFAGVFPSLTIAMEINILLYGVIGAAFSMATFIYEKDRIGFVIQNLLYVLMTGAIWIPIVAFIWQLPKYPQAFFSTLGGFFGTYLIMTFVGYRITKREVEGINRILEDKQKGL